MLQAARVVELDVVLAIGYQIQMGEEWNSRHRNELRRDRDGQPLSHWGSGETASPLRYCGRRKSGWFGSLPIAHVVTSGP